MKTQKTVRLDDAQYCIANDGQLMVHISDWSDEPTGKPGEMYSSIYNQYEIQRLVPSRIQVGATVVLLSREHVHKGGEQFYIKADPDIVANGVPGNMNHNIHRFHGWRGTTCDIAVYAHGKRHVLKISELRNGQIAVTVGRDVAPNED